MKKTIILDSLVIGWCLMAGVSSAQNTILDFSGFMYEEDNTPDVVGFPPSNPGDVLAACGFIENIGPELEALGWDPATHEFTLVLSDLVSEGEIDYGGGLFYINYTGGTVDIVAQPYNDPGYTMPDYGTDPPNATAPSTFWDGDTYLHGELYLFYMIYYPTLHAGNFEGYMNWTGGSQLDPDVLDPEGYSLAGTVDPLAAPVPDGYDLEMVGHISFDPTIPAEQGTWGQVKNLYR